MMETQHGGPVGGDKFAALRNGGERPPSFVKGGKPGPGRPKGSQDRVTVTLKAAVEMAARDCHPEGLAGWLVDRANGSIGDRQIFAALVGKVIPIQVNQSVEGGISINLNWLGGRAIGTVAAQNQQSQSQPVDLIEDSGGRYQIVDQHTQQQAPAGAAAGDAQEAPGAHDRPGT